MTSGYSNQSLALAAIVALLAGVFGGHAIWAKEVSVENPVNADLMDANSQLEAKLALAEQVKTEVQYVNVTNEVRTEVEVDYPGKALQTVLDRIGDEDEFLTCGGDTYDEDEVSVTKVYDGWSYTPIDKDDGKYEITFSAKFRFHDGSDNSPCRETREYSVTYEDGEKPDVELVE